MVLEGFKFPTKLQLYKENEIDQVNYQVIIYFH